MNGFDPAEFGKAFDQIQMAYQTGIGRYLAPVFHVAAFGLFCYLFISKKRSKPIVSVWFAVNYAWIFLYAGIHMFYQFYQRLGWHSIMFWGIMPVLLAGISIHWLLECVRPQT